MICLVTLPSQKNYLPLYTEMFFHPLPSEYFLPTDTIKYCVTLPWEQFYFATLPFIKLFVIHPEKSFSAPEIYDTLS